MNNKERYWRETGRLKKSNRKPLDLSFWRFIILISWSSDWTWGELTKDDDLRTNFISFSKRERYESGKVLTCWSLLLFKLSVKIGFVSKK